MVMSKILCAWLCCAAVVALPLLCAAGDVPESNVELSGREDGDLVSNKPASRQDNVNVRGRKFDGWSGASAAVSARNAGPATTHFRLAEELTLAGRLDAALSSYTVAITLEPDHAGALQGRWRLCSRLSLHRQALKDLNRLIELMPGRAEYYYERGRTLLKLNSIREAYRDFLRANELDRRYPRPTLIEDDAPEGRVLVA